LKRRRPILHSLGTACGQGPAPMGRFGNGRHLGCGELYPSSRRGAKCGPLESSVKAGVSRRRARKRVSLADAKQADFSSRRNNGSATQGVRGDMGVGAKLSSRAIMTKGAGAGENRSRPLTLEASTSIALQKAANSNLRTEESKTRTCGAGVYGDSRVVLANRYDCRSRRATCG